MPDDSGQGDSGRPVDGPPESAGISAHEEGNPGSRVIKLLIPAHLTGEGETEATLGRLGFDNHSPSLGGSRTISAVWIESQIGDTSGLGRVMWQRLDSHAAANDNAVWVTQQDGAGAIGCEPLVTALLGGETLLTWIGADGHAHGKLYPPGDDTGVDSDADAYAAVNASLADLGPTVSAAESNRRLQVIEQRPGNLAVMWIALAETGYVLRGSIFSTPQSDSGSASQAEVFETAEIPLPLGFNGQFSLQRSGDAGGDAYVHYAGSQGSSVMLALRKGDPLPEVSAIPALDASDTGVLADKSGATGAMASRDAAADGGVDVAVVEAPELAAGAGPFPLVLNLAAGAISDPVVAAIEGGFAVVWEEPGTTEKAVAIKIALFDQHGVARTLADGSTSITVTDNALATVTPSLTGLGTGAAVAYVDASAGSLMIEAFNSSGSQIGKDVVVDDGSSGAISEIAMASRSGENSKEIAVIYVRDDHDDDVDYGSIMLQRYRVSSNEDSSDSLVAVGSDGQADGNDLPRELTTVATVGGETSTYDVHGRAPAVAELDDGDVAIVWVENDGGRETIKGCVLEADGSQVLRIDLTALLQDSGIVKGTKPILVANADGDILVSWLQREGGDGDYVVMAAIYDSIGPGQWVAPDHPMPLQEFERQPKNFTVSWSGEDASAIDVSWQLDGSGSGSGGTFKQRFDLDGNDIGNATKLYSGSSLTNGDSSTAGLVDGQIVVVYAEQGNKGNLELAAQVIDGQTGSTSALSVDQAMSTAGSAHDYTVSVSSLSTDVDQEIAVNVFDSDSDAAVTHINGKPITASEPIDVGSGWVQLREDGGLTFSPDSGYSGDVAFDYTLSNKGSGSSHKGRVEISVESDQKADSATVGVKLADLELSDGEISTDGLTAAGLDPDMFKIVGNMLYLKAGLEFDFNTAPSLTVEVRAHGGSEPETSANFTLDVADNSGSGSVGHELAADVFVFARGFGEGSSGHHHYDDSREVIDMSSSPYSTLQELIESGALVQAGEDIVITMDPTDPDHSDKITLRGIELSSLTSSDFKF